MESDLENHVPETGDSLLETDSEPNFSLPGTPTVVSTPGPSDESDSASDDEAKILAARLAEEERQRRGKELLGLGYHVLLNEVAADQIRALRRLAPEEVRDLPEDVRKARQALFETYDDWHNDPEDPVRRDRFAAARKRYEDVQKLHRLPPPETFGTFKSAERQLARERLLNYLRDNDYFGIRDLHLTPEEAMENYYAPYLEGLQHIDPSFPLPHNQKPEQQQYMSAYMDKWNHLGPITGGKEEEYRRREFMKSYMDALKLVDKSYPRVASLSPEQQRILEHHLAAWAAWKGQRS